MTLLAPALQAFFTGRLINQRNSSPQTIAAYRDTFRLLLRTRAFAGHAAIGSSKPSFAPSNCQMLWMRR